MTTEHVTNTSVPITFYIDDKEKEFNFHLLTIKENNTFRAKMKAMAREEWLARVRDMASILTDQKEKAKFLVEVSSQEPDWASEVSRIAQTPPGIMQILKIGCKEDIGQDTFEKIDSDVRNADNIIYALKTVMGIKPDIGEKKEEVASDPQ